jgi:hypothetical protein
MQHLCRSARSLRVGLARSNPLRLTAVRTFGADAVRARALSPSILTLVGADTNWRAWKRLRARAEHIRNLVGCVFPNIAHLALSQPRRVEGDVDVGYR